MLNFTDFLDYDEAQVGNGSLGSMGNSPSPRNERMVKPFVPVRVDFGEEDIPESYRVLQDTLEDIERSIVAAEISMEGMSNILTKAPAFRKVQAQLEKLNTTPKWKRKINQQSARGVGIGRSASDRFGNSKPQFHSESATVLAENALAELDDGPLLETDLAASYDFDSAEAAAEVAAATSPSGSAASFPAFNMGTNVGTGRSALSSPAPSPRGKTERIAKRATTANANPPNSHRPFVTTTSNNRISAEVGDAQIALVDEVVSRLASFCERRRTVREHQSQIIHDVDAIRQNLPALLHHLMRLAEDIMNPHSGVYVLLSVLMNLLCQASGKMIGGTNRWISRESVCLLLH